MQALILIGPGCPHCSAALEALTKLVKDGELGRLEVINAAAEPDVATGFGVRSVPWIRLGKRSGEYEFDSALTLSEIRHWLSLMQAETGIREYLAHLLEDNQLSKVIGLIKEHNDYIPNLLTLLTDHERDLKIKLGINAVLESLEGSDVLRKYVDMIGRLASNDDERVRADAAHTLGLTHSQQAMPYLQSALSDPDAEVREIAQDALESL